MVKKKVFKFKQNDVVDVTEMKTLDSNVIECGRNRFTLHEFKAKGYENDTLQYAAVLYINNKPFFNCSKDESGVTKIIAVDNKSGIFKKCVEAQLKKYKWSMMGHEYILTLEFIADNIANSYYKDGEL